METCPFLYFKMHGTKTDATVLSMYSLFAMRNYMYIIIILFNFHQNALHVEYVLN